ncbi:phosphatase PAP2 family protein [Dongia sp. agr-C8]
MIDTTRAAASNLRTALRRRAARARSFASQHGWHGANLAIPLLMIVYTAVAALLCRALGRGVDFRPDLYVIPFYVSYLLYAITLGAILTLRKRQGRIDRRLLFFSGGWQPSDLVRHLISAAPFLLAWPIFMSGFTAVKTLLNDVLPFTWDARFMEIGKQLHFGQHAWEWLAIDNPLVTRFLEGAYAFWGVLLVAVPFGVALRRPHCPLRTRFLISYLLVLVLLGNIAAGAFMSAGPFWFEFTGATVNDYAGLFSYLTQVDPNGDFSAIAFQRYLWEVHQLGTTELGTGISAFPSIHVAAATLYVLLAWPFGRIPRIAATLYLILIMVGAVHLGWHYAVDCYAGSLGAAAIYTGVGAVQRLLSRLRPVPAELQSAPA